MNENQEDGAADGATNGAEANAPEAANDQPAAAAADPDAARAARIVDLEGQVAELRDQLLRAMAETENIRKRGERQIEDAHKYAVTGFARDVLSVADNLERALEAVPEERRGEDELLATLLEGVTAVQAGFAQTLAAHKIERIDPAGEPFDPNFHEAMFEVPGTDLPDGSVAQVVQPGYRLHDRLLRPARVGVAKGGNAGGGAGDDPQVDTTA
jgi:molecular chaperone GrpE